ncbi:MAG: hypothetical protein Rubg2KO_34170 [Rubricoccaceae bacterium]
MRREAVRAQGAGERAHRALTAREAVEEENWISHTDPYAEAPFRMPVVVFRLAGGAVQWAHLE